MKITTLKLEEPTAFPDLNAAEGKEPGFERDALNLSSLKYKHFRAVAVKPEEDQMHYLMMQMTGLSDDDLGELLPSDAAKLSELVFDSMKEYMQLGQKIVKNMELDK